MYEKAMMEFEQLFSLGGKIGSHLRGADFEGTDIIEVIEFNNGRLIAKCIEKNGKPFDGGECNWTLSLRKWELVK
jgi:hypothetical protein